MPAPVIPALSFHALTALFDPLLRYALPEAEMRQSLIDQAALSPGMSVLDVGCGTGSLLLRLHDRGLRLTGTEPDPGARRIAQQKLAALPDLCLLDADAAALPLPDASQDAAFASLILHHMLPPTRRRALAEIRRVLRPGGQLHVLDFGQMQNTRERIGFWSVRIVDGLENTAGFTGDIVGESLHAAGFRCVGMQGRVGTVFGGMGRWRGER